MAKYKPLTREERKEKDAEYIKNVASLFIEGIKENKVPWMKPWKSNEYMADHNPVTKTVYSGINEVYLGVVRELVLNSTDPRWYTFHECKELDYNVRKGSKGSVVSFFEQLPCDKDGKVIPLEQKDTTEIKFHKSYSKKWVVFNGSQIDVARKDEKGNNVLDNDGKPLYDPLLPYVPPEQDKRDEFIPIEKAEKLIDKSGAVIKHDSKNSYYRPSTDEIHLLPKDQYLSPELYYDTALHELAHWTGHKERLGRPMMDKYGTIDYAREELNAEIAGYMMCKKLNLDFNPQNNIAYVQSWVKKLSDVPSDIFDACATASKISNYCLAFTDKIRQTQKGSQRENLGESKKKVRR